MARAPAEGHNSTALLRSFVDRIGRLEADRKELAADIKEIKAEAKSQGYDTKVIAQMVREDMMDEAARAKQREFEDLCEVYRASLGMLNGTPLGESARKRIAEPPAPDKKPDSAQESPGDDEPPAPEDEKPQEFPAEDIAAARSRGHSDAAAGAKITENPFMSGDPRRAAWDEGWCESRGSDGMEIPDAWRRKPKQPTQGGRP